MGTFSIWHWLIVLVVVVLVFGSKKLADAGPDLGKAIRGFRDNMRGGDKDDADKSGAQPTALESREQSGATTTTPEKTASS